MRLLAVGDIHGHLSALNALLEVVRPSNGDKIIFLGDYVDKGPDVKGVLDRLLELAAKQDAVFLRGNHDQMMLDAFQDASRIPIWECLGGKAPLASYGEGSSVNVMEEVPAEHLRFLGDVCTDYFETPDFIFVHGGIRAHLPPSHEEQERLLWTTLSTAGKHASGRTVICGHSSQRTGEIADLHHTICIDTNITHGGWLTCLALDTFEYWQANAEGICRSGWLRGRA